MEYLFITLLLTILISNLWIYLWHKNRPSGEKAELQILSRERDQLFEENARLKSELDVRLLKQGESDKELREVFAQKDHLSGENKTLLLQKASLEADLRTVRSENAELRKSIGEFEAHTVRKTKEHEEKLKQLDQSRQSFEDEKLRIRREDEAARAAELAERDRVWNEHENLVKSHIQGLCQKPEIGFRYFDNTNLPDDFDGTLKPDCLIEFLGQYVIFDAKYSKKLTDYISGQVKKTAEKVKRNDKIYRAVFLVVPLQDIGSLKKTVFVEEGVTFYIVPTIALEPLLVTLRHIAQYELLTELDPRDKHALIHLIANYDRHLLLRNAADLLLAQQSLNLVEGKSSLSSDWQADIETYKKTLNPLPLSQHDLKRFSVPEVQQHIIDSFINSKPDISKSELIAAETFFNKTT